MRRALGRVGSGRHTVPIACLIAVSAPLALRDGYTLHLLNVVGIYVILSVSLNVSVGMAGLLHLGHASFYGIGAYVGAIASTRILPGSGAGFWIGFPLVIVVGLMGGALLGAPSLRLKGHYFAIATLGFGEITRSLMLNLVSITNGPFGIKAIPSPKIGSLDLGPRERFYYLTLVIVALTLVTVGNLQRGRFGRFWESVREDEIVAQVMGVNVYAAKLSALMISSALAGIAGWLYAHYVSYINPSNFSMDESILILCMVVLGGRGRLWGPVAGTALLVLIPEILRPVAEFRLLMYGIALAALMAYRPEGLVNTR